jgi:hypothetical protein
MKRNLLIVLYGCVLLPFVIHAQLVSSSLPKPIAPTERFIFYLHGAVVTVLGDNAVNKPAPEWGPYQYSHILDSLRSLGYNVISERRIPDVENSVYVNKIVLQVDSLLKAGVKNSNILLIGASAGSDIVLHVSARLKNKQMHYAVMGGCWPQAYKDYYAIEIYGYFLSVIEASDPHGTCMAIFKERKNITGIKEITLHTGLSHGFLYRPYKAWVDPVLVWFNTSK